MELMPRSLLWTLTGFITPITLAGIINALYQTQWIPQILSSAQPRPQALPSNTAPCQTITADPKPPLNVRSSPIVATNNAIGQLPNGTVLTIIDENEGWLKINTPLQGWVYKELTVTSCADPSDPSSPQIQEVLSTGSSEQGTKLLAIATQQFQAGNLSGAIALAKTIPPNNAAYQPATALAAQWQQDWNRAESEYYIAQKASRDGRWQDVLSQVDRFPNIRFWKEKLTPLVKQAIEHKKLAPPKEQPMKNG
jgi:hypothetical protein